VTGRPTQGVRQPLANADEMRSALLLWYGEVKRDLPWRRVRDGWATLVSEIMLQQTRVETVIPYYERFMTRFPAPASLAEASDAEVLRYWSGLGYYRRARFLKAAAAQVVEQHGGQFPADYDAIFSLPGVGRYTAGAVASIAFGIPVPVVDGNVIRVLSRIGRVGGDPKKRAVSDQLWSMAGELVDPAAPGESNQALMELGATICSKTAPLCISCPVSRWCGALSDGDVSRYPETAAPRESKQVRLVALALLSGSGESERDVLLVRRAAADRMEGLLDLPSVELPPRARAKSAINRLADALGWELDSVERCGEARHAITHHRIRAEVFVGVGRRRSGRAALPAAFRRDRIAPTIDAEAGEWVALQSASSVELSSVGRKLLALVVAWRK